MIRDLCGYLVDTIGVLGYPGIFILMAIESSCFVPFPSEIVMIPAGWHIHEGKFSWFPVIASGLAGSVFGAWINYYLALKLGRPFFIRYGKYFFVSEASIQKSEAFFARHGSITTFVGRLIPGVRQLISLPAGFARMPFWRFTAYTTLGAGIWITILTVIGYLVGSNQEQVNRYVRDALVWALVGAAILVVGYIWWQRRKNRPGDAPVNATRPPPSQ